MSQCNVFWRTFIPIVYGCNRACAQYLMVSKMIKNDNTNVVLTSVEAVVPTDMLHLGQILAPILISNIRYDPVLKLWRIYQDGYWQKDHDNIQVSKIVETLLRQLRETLLNNNLSQADKDEVYKFFDSLFTPDKVKLVLRSCAVNRSLELTATSDAFDQNPMLLNCLNGTVNLIDGTLLNHNCEDLLSRQASVSYDENAKCPAWRSFVLSIMGNDKEKAAYLQRCIGYGITGITKEHCFFLLQGNGSNGKSTMLEVLREIFADYVGNLPNESLLLNFRTVRSDIVRLQGQRIVTTNELKVENRPIDEALIKALTAGDMQTARESGKNEVDFIPQLKLFIATNHLPVIKGTDDGIWRRVRLITFGESFTGKNCDKDLLEKLRGEAAGILNWCIEGCLNWQKDGLNEPEVVLNDSRLFRSDSNPVSQFIEDRCEIFAGNKIPLKEIYTDYITWCEENCFSSETNIAFSKRMVALGYTKGKSGSIRYWKDLRFKTAQQPSTDTVSTSVTHPSLPSVKKDPVASQIGIGKADGVVSKGVEAAAT